MAYAMAYVKTNAARGGSGHGYAVGRITKRARLGGSSPTRARRREPEQRYSGSSGESHLDFGFIARPIGLRRDDGGAVMAGEIGIGPARCCCSRVAAQV